MKDGTYKVIKFIHVHCENGQLKIAEGTWIEINGDRAIAANSIRFPSKMLDTVQDCLKKIK